MADHKSVIILASGPELGYADFDSVVTAGIRSEFALANKFAKVLGFGKAASVL